MIENGTTYEISEVPPPSYRLERAEEGGQACCHLFMETFEKIDEKNPLLWRPTSEHSWPKVATVWPDKIKLRPIHANHYAQRYLKPRHGMITTILYIDNAHEALPQDQGEARDQIDTRLPWGLFTQDERELGFSSPLEEVLRVLGRTFGRDTLVVVREGRSRLEGNEVILSCDDLNKLRRAMNRIDRRKREGVRQAKWSVVFTELLTVLDPSRFGRSTPSEYKMVNISELAQPPRPVSWQRRAMQSSVKQVQSMLPALAANSPTSLLELHSEIERVTLSEMITRYAQLLEEGHPEGHWQKFFQSNLLVLSLVFARPVTLLQTQFHARGSTIDGSGAQVGDFLFGDWGRGLAIVEIKKPGTELVSRSPYRNSEVYAPTTELSGAITQTLVQQSELRKRWLAHQENQKLQGRSPDVIKCVVVAGKTPVDDHQRRSFDIFRDACKDVEVLTFDELLGKLRSLLEHLTPKPNDPPF